LLLPAIYGFDCNSLADELQRDCIYLKSVNETQIANLIYTSHFTTDHQFIRNYNGNIEVETSPFDVEVKNSAFIRDAWTTILYIEPSILYEEKLFVGSPFRVHVDYNYRISLPNNWYNNYKDDGDICKVTYNLDSSYIQQYIQIDNLRVDSAKVATFVISDTKVVEAHLIVDVTIKEKIYRWHYLGEGDWDCDRDEINYISSHIHMQDEKHIYAYTPQASANFTIYYTNENVLNGNLSESLSNYILQIGESTLTSQQFYYSATFDHEPYYLLQLKAENVSIESVHEISRNDQQIIAPYSESCSLQVYGWFRSHVDTCKYDIVDIEVEENIENFSKSWRLLIVVSLFLFAIYLIYLGLKYTWGRYLFVFLVLVSTIPVAFADECGLSNLGGCLPESFFNFSAEVDNNKKSRWAHIKHQLQHRYTLLLEARRLLIELTCKQHLV
jgi:hypothetical protein